MGLEVVKQFFKDKSEVLEDIKQTGYWPTTYVSDPSPALDTHWHDVDINGYVIKGSTWVRDGVSGERLSLEAGDKLIIPAGALHAEGEVTDSVTYIVACSRAGQLFKLLKMRSPDDPQRPAS